MQISDLAQILKGKEPMRPTRKEIEIAREWLSRDRSPGGKRYGHWEEGYSFLFRFELWVKWYYRLNDKEYNRLCTLAFLENILPDLIDQWESHED